MKLLTLALASASALSAPSTAASTSVTPIRVDNTATKLFGGLRTSNRSSSRPYRIPGEVFFVGGPLLTSGHFEIGDLVEAAHHDSSSFESDLLVGAALAFRAWQTPVDRAIQTHVSRNFEAYWD
jgi:hypothetical protein